MLVVEPLMTPLQPCTLNYTTLKHPLLRLRFTLDFCCAVRPFSLLYVGTGIMFIEVVEISLPVQRHHLDLDAPSSFFTVFLPS
jgi:hypothetical protein